MGRQIQTSRVFHRGDQFWRGPGQLSVSFSRDDRGKGFAMTLKNHISQDADVFLNLDEFAEEIIYTNAAGTAKTIRAVVVRYELSPTQENVYRSLKKQADVYIARDDTRGIREVNKKDDRVTLKDTEGVERESRINEIVNCDEGLWHLMVGW